MGVLFCGGGGNPTPTVTWQRLLPGWVVEEVIIDGRIQIADNFLLFTDVRLSDEGTYFCTLTSALGNRTSSKTLLNVYSESTSIGVHVYFTLIFVSIKFACKSLV